MSRSPLTSCATLLQQGQKYVALRLLTAETLYIVVEAKMTGQDVFVQTCNYLGLVDAELFGLATLTTDGKYQFINRTLRVSKFAPKAWKSQEGMGLGSNGMPLLTFHLRVQFYVDCHLLISDKVARHHYYLQTRENVTTYQQSISEERAFLLAAYALQADLGNYQRDKHTGHYFNPYKYFPNWIVDRIGEAYIVQHTPALHRDNSSLSRAEAQVGYIKGASETTAPHNIHLYKMKRKKSKSSDLVWLGICAKGLEIYEDNGKFSRKKISTFLWVDIAKITFEKKKFEIRSEGGSEMRKFTYYAAGDELCKSLFWLCRTTHQFNMAVQPRVQELRKMELEALLPAGHKTYRESYIYSDSLDLAWEQGRSSGSSELLKKNNNDQRVSVISNASSNTTSGIVSDKVTLHCESEDDVELEMNAPPAHHHFEDSLLAEDGDLNDRADDFQYEEIQTITTAPIKTAEEIPRRWTDSCVLGRPPSPPLVINSPVAKDSPLPEAINPLVARCRSRTAPRIGVSSLSRVQILPQTLFGQAGSEPSLNCMPTWSSVDFPESPQPLSLPLSSLADETGMMLPLGSSRSTGNIPCELSAVACIPPPPAYANEQQDKTVPNGEETEFGALDIHQLRQKSRDMDLPLISALCNEALLLPPKTVASCPRRRHAGVAADTRRFSCSYMPSASDGQFCFVTGSLPLNNSRPLSWHVDETLWFGQMAAPLRLHSDSVPAGAATCSFMSSFAQPQTINY